MVLDLEDAVPAEAKESARDAAVRAATVPRTKPLWVRVNAVGTPWSADDLAALAGADLDGVRVPKAGDPGTIAGLAQRLGLPLHLLLETALGVEQAYALATAHPPVVAVSLGEADLAADLGVRRPDALAWARQRVVVASRAAGLAAPITSVWTDLADPDGLARDSREARDQGFFGRSVIHPKQVEPVHRAFTPSADEVDRRPRAARLAQPTPPAAGRAPGSTRRAASSTPPSSPAPTACSSRPTPSPTPAEHPH